MKTPSPVIIAFAVLFALAVAGGCDRATAPSGDNSYFGGFSALSEAAYGPDTLYLWSGQAACGEYDPVVFVSSPCEPAFLPALVGGGSTDTSCACAIVGDPLSASLPVATRCETDSVGDFEAYFDLPAGFVDVAIDLSLVADDGAQIFVNGTLIDQVDLNDGDPAAPAVVRHVAVTGDTLFVAGRNVLSFHLVNTGAGAYGEPVARADSADCMYLEFAADVRYFIPPNVTIDIKPGSDVNPINCTNENGVIPVAVLTTDEFDAMNVDYATIRFGPGGAIETHGKIHVEDVDYDGDMDVMLHFRGSEAAIACGDTAASLWGKTVEGYDFMSHDHIRTVGEKKK